MFKFAPLILKTLWRHRARTLLTVGGTAIALFVFCFVASLHTGLDRLARQPGAQDSLVVFQANKFCPATSHLPQDYDRLIRALPSVRDVVPIQVFTNNCRASLDVIVFHGVPPAQISQMQGLGLSAGSWDDFLNQQDAAVVGRAVAGRLQRQRGIGLGDKFTLGGYTVTIAGIFAAKSPEQENYIYTHLDFLQRGPGRKLVGTVTQFEVLLEPGADVERLCKQIDDRLQSESVATDSRPKGAFQRKSLGDLIELVALSQYLGYACVGLVLVLVATTSVMTVEDRVKEHAVMQTIGFTGRKIFLLVLSESLVLSALGGAIGVGAAMLSLAWTDLSVGAEAVTVSFAPSTGLASRGLAYALAAGLCAGVLPAWRAAAAQIVPALREP